MAPNVALFLLVMVTEVLLAAALIVSLVSEMRVWPPPRRASWQFWVVWSLSWLAFAGLVALGVADWDSFVLPPRIRFPIGTVMVAGGLTLVAWGVHGLGVRATAGLKGELITSGAFRRSRNPQYVGEIIWLLGYGVLTNSALTLIGAGFGGVLFIVVPFTEEPWLHDRFGAAFERYVASVPRFVGRRSLRR